MNERLPWVKVVQEPIEADRLVQRVSGPQIGGIDLFIGTVRGITERQETRYLEYAAYEAMAVEEMQRICDEALQRWPEVLLAAEHRVGHLEVGEVAVAVAAGAPHRADAFAACRFVIDAIKSRAPIWKKEVTPSGTFWVSEHPQEENHG
ncbi:MAG: molybdenum cofactor biosynthesis protein MoaE [Firmicutes bacterium]|nr:molybdenum cofactor biosynthesis protein MoaE [Bacillota bacterium]